MENVEKAHVHSTNHRKEIEQSKICGCFYCLSMFKPNEIVDWCDVYADEIGGLKYGHTALCPKCSIDSVLGSASGYPITREFLSHMKGRWF
ncbi:cytoplasmic protein [Vibrio parahaemolyticus]|nr:cytoplasmic protein [Vibrio parahaemolyticus]